MRKVAIVLAAVSGAIALCCSASKPQSSAPPVILRTSTVLDGRRQVLRDVAIVVETGKIARLHSTPKAASYDLRGLTVLPGWIDAHVHPPWHFAAAGRLAGPDGTEEENVSAGAANP